MQETGGDTHPFFEWSTTGKYGKLKDSKGHTGSSFATADNKVVFESDALAELKNGDNIDYIYVKASFNNVLIGMDTVMVNVKKTNYEMRPANAVVTGKKYSKAANDINLYLFNINTSVRDIPNHESLDFKIEWSTPGIYGNLTGATTTYNDDDIVYKATSELTGVFTENITARIYTKNKSETDYSFYSSITGKVKIDNEEKKKIIFVSAALFHGDSTHPYYYNGAGWGTLGQCYRADGVVVDKDPDAERYELTFDITKNIIGAPKAHSWKADATSPYPPPTFVPGYSTKTYRVVYSWGALNYNPAQGEKHVNDSGTNIAGAWITIYLK